MTVETRESEVELGEEALLDGWEISRYPRIKSANRTLLDTAG